MTQQKSVFGFAESRPLWGRSTRRRELIIVVRRRGVESPSFMLAANVRSGSEADIDAVSDHVCLVPQAEVPDSRQRLAFDLLRSAANTTLRPCYARLV